MDEQRALEILAGGMMARGGELVSEVAALKARIAALTAERDAARSALAESQAHAARLAEALRKQITTHDGYSPDGCAECSFYGFVHNPGCPSLAALAATPADSVARWEALEAHAARQHEVLHEVQFSKYVRGMGWCCPVCEAEEGEHRDGCEMRAAVAATPQGSLARLRRLEAAVAASRAYRVAHRQLITDWRMSTPEEVERMTARVRAACAELDKALDALDGQEGGR